MPETIHDWSNMQRFDCGTWSGEGRVSRLSWPQVKNAVREAKSPLVIGTRLKSGTTWTFFLVAPSGIILDGGNTDPRLLRAPAGTLDPATIKLATEYEAESGLYIVVLRQADGTLTENGRAILRLLGGGE